MATHMLTLEPDEVAGEVRLRVDDDLFRSRLKAWLRLWLIVPYVVALYAWWIVAAILFVVAWVSAVATGRCPRAVHEVLARFVRYSVHVQAFTFLVSDPFPPFTGRIGYPIEVEIPPPGRQRRLGVALRPLLALPAGLVVVGLSLVVMAASVPGWVACVVVGRMPERLRNLSAYCLAYGARTSAYTVLLTSAYPSFQGADDV